MIVYIILNIVVVFLFGTFWGFAELLQRYKEWKYIFRRNAENEESVLGYVVAYILLNGIVSIIAFLLIKFFNNEKVSAINDFEIKNILIASFGGMMILRSSIFSIKQNNKDVEIGLATVVQIFLDTIDRKINHNIAARRVCDIHEIMQNIDFEKAKKELPALCMEFIDNFNDEDSKTMLKKINEIDTDSNLSNINKSLQLGREIAKYCDTEILIRVIKKLPDIKIEHQNNVDITSDEFEKRKSQLNS